MTALQEDKIEQKPHLENKHQNLKYNYNSQVSQRKFHGSADRMASSLLVVFTLFIVMLNLNGEIPQATGSGLFLGYVILLVFMLYPHEKSSNKGVNYIPLYDMLAALFGTGSFIYLVTSADALSPQGTGLMGFHWTTPALLGLCGMMALGEACRRVAGASITWISFGLFLYAFASGRPVTRIVYDLFFTEQGVMGAAAQVCASYISLFIIFGSFLESIGLTSYFLDLGKLLVGRRAGGAAKSAVISSALCGTITGSSVCNTVNTGSETIPLMKKHGYPPVFASAVEASASIGGQIMPPIMGSAVFLMAVLHHIPYVDLMQRAILPAFLYYLGIFFMVHFYSHKKGLKPLPSSEIPSLSQVWKQSYLLLPLLVFLVLVLLRFPLEQGIFMGIFTCICLGIVDKDITFTRKVVWDVLEKSAKHILPVAAACGMAGVISGVVTTTGLGQYLISAVVSVSGNHLFIALFATMICCLLLGMTVPTIANYVIMTSIFAPILIQGMGMDVLLANMFVFYFGIVSDVTPPVSLASWAAATIAKTDYWETAWMASKLSLGVFMIPYFIAFHPDFMLLDTTVARVVMMVFIASVGMFSLSAGIIGYMYGELSTFTRILFLIGGVLLILPETYTDVVGLVLMSLLVYQRIISFTQRSKKIK